MAWVAAFAACLALPFATRSLPFTAQAEIAVHDVYRYLLAPRVPPDPDIALVLYDDAVARETGRTSPIDRAMLARALAALENAGVRSIGIDLLFITPTGDEDALTQTLARARVPVFLAFADPAADRTTYWPAAIDAEARAYQDAFWRAADNPLVRQVSPVIRADDSGVARAWPMLGTAGNPPLALAQAGAAGAEPSQAGQGYSGAIAYRLPEPPEGDDAAPAPAVFPAYSMNLFTDPDLAPIFAPELAGKHVMIGTDIFAVDRLATPLTRIAGEPKVAGVTVHAHMLRQALDGNFPRPLPAWALGLLAALAVAAGAGAGLVERRPVLLATALAGIAAALAALPPALAAAGFDFLSLPLVGLSIAAGLAFFLAATAKRSRTSVERAFARDALGRYLPAGVAREILEAPEKLGLAGEERELAMMFTDLEGFTAFSHGRDPRETAQVLNTYLDEMSEIVLAHEGTLDKFVGDAIVAFWGAPLAGADDAARCLACALALFEASERLRTRMRETFGDTVGRTRIGLHHGPAVVGNFGGGRRIQYTALGDAMNVAARLEGANKHLRTKILASAALVERAPGFACRPMGWIALSGVGTPIEVFEPLAAGDAASIAPLADAIRLIDLGDDAGMQAIRELSAAQPDDAALAALAARIATVTREAPYVLASK